MDPRRRTMQPAPDPYGNAPRSGIPVPASAMKKSVNQNPTRMSLAGPPQRAPQTGPSMNPRQSLYASQNINPLLQSVGKAVGRTPLANTVRRGSMWPGARPTLMAPGPANIQPAKDTRPLRDKQFQAKMRQDILNFLRESSYEPMITMATLISIPAKDFRGIFDHLVAFVDPYYPFTQKGKAKFEDDFTSALKSLRYPFPIDSKGLATPASMHTWPNLLGVLHWLVELSREKYKYLESAHSSLQIVDQVPDEFDEPNHHHAWFFDYYANAYDDFLGGSDDLEDEFQILEERYTKKNEKIVSALEAQKEGRSKLQTEHDRLVSSPAPIIELQNSHNFLTRDRKKFEDVLAHWEGRRKKLIDTIAFEKADLVARAENLEQLKAERERLEGVIKDQNLSPQEVTRMNTEHEALSRNLDDLKHKVTETNRAVLSLEVTVSNRGASAEEAVDIYTSLLYRLSLFPRAPPPHDSLLLALELNTAASSPKDLLIGAPELNGKKGVIRAVLGEVAAGKRRDRMNLEKERVGVENQLDQISQECENLEEETVALESKVAAIHEQAEDLREAAQQETAVSNAEAARLERDLAHARTAALANGVGVKSRLQALQIAYQEQIEKVERLRDETVRAIMKSSSDIALFKQEVSNQLDSLRVYAEEN